MKHHKSTMTRWTGRGLGGAILITGVAAAAHAADPTADQHGLMTFPHVRVVSGPPVAARPGSARVPEPQRGFKAFLDPVTGQLVEPTADDAAALEAAGQVRTRAYAEQEPVRMIGPDGGIGVVLLDESQMSYVVAHKNADGALGVGCVPGAQAARSSFSGAGISTIKPLGNAEPK